MKALIRNITVVCAIGFAFLIMWALPKSVHAAGTTTTYTFNVNMLSSDSDKERIVEGTEFDGFIKTYGSVIKRWSSQYGVSSTEVGKAGTGGFMFTISGEADVKIVTSSTGGSNESAVALVDEKGNKKTNKQGIGVVAGTGKTELTYKGLAKGTYKFISPEDPYRSRGARVYEIKITETIGSTCWESIEKPSLVSVNVIGADIIIRYRMLIGYNGADQVILSLYNAETGDELETKTFEEEGGEGTAVFTPTVSGKYFCSIRAVRENEEDKVGINSATIDYSKRLTAPQIKKAINQGKGSVKIIFNPVQEAQQYVITENGIDIFTYTPENLSADEYVCFVDGLTPGTEVTLGVIAVRGDDRSPESTLSVNITSEMELEWAFANFGSNATTDRTKSGFIKKEDSVTVYNLANSGKLVPVSTDGLSFYYAAIPAEKNFTLSATASIDQWTFVNGQEGFGLMAADRVGKDGENRAFWNNSYMAVGTRVDYYIDSEGNITDDTNAKMISMKSGLGSREKVGITADNLAEFESADSATAVKSYFRTSTRPLETSAAEKVAGTYNLFGNATSEVPGTMANASTVFKLKIQKNNTGYFISYEDKSGRVTTQKYYDTKALEQIDTEYVYAGFFASRAFKVTYSDIHLTLVDPADDAPADDAPADDAPADDAPADDAPADDAPAEERPITYVEPEYRVISDTLATTSKYKLELFSNADGAVSVIDMDGEIIAENLAIIAGEKLTIPITLPELENSFKIMIVPNKDFKPLGESSLLTTYEAREIIFKVTRKGTVVGDGVTAIYNHDNFEIVFYSDGGTLWNDWREKSGLAVSKSIRVADKGKVYLPEDSSRLFAGGYEKIDLKGFDTSHVVDMSYMFASCGAETFDLSHWNFSNVTNVAHMFSGCIELTELNMSNCDLSSVTNMENMLEHCVGLRTLNMNGINLSNVTDIKSVFRENCLAHIDLSNANLSSVENISSLFYDSYKLISVDLSGADMSSVKNMRYMFAWCSQLTTLKLDALNISSVTDMSHMFDDCICLATLDMSGLDTSNVTNMSGMFSGCRQLAALEMRGWDFSSVSTMENMFDGCENLVSLGLNDVKTSNMTTMDYMFSGCSGLKNLNLSSFDTSNVTSMKSMFSNCSGLTDLDLSMFDTLKVTSTDSMFSGCSGLTKLDISTLNTSNVTSMTSMFSGCTGLTNLDLSAFDTSNVTSMAYMFSGCTGLTNLDLSAFDTSNVASMAYMFSGCTGLTDLDLSAFDTLNVTTMNSMFSGCEGLTELVLSTFDTSNVTSMYSMFSGCSGLTAVDLSGFNTSLVSNRNDVFAGCTRLQVLITPGTSGVSIELPKVMFDREGKAYKVLPLLGKSIVLANPQQLAIEIACPESIILERESITVQRGGTLKLEAAVVPDKFYVNKAVRWSSSDDSVATVDAYGNVSAIKVGKADISVTAEEGGASAVCVLTVTAPNATGITIDKESASINVGKTLQITAAVEPSDANQNISWSSSDDSVVVVNQSGVVTALKEGSAVVTATSVEGDFTAVCNITVKKNVTFTDVDNPSAWYYDSVYWAVANGVTSGMGEGTFQPMAKLSRAQSVTFLYNLVGRPDVSGLEAKEFSDVPKSAWYYNAVKWAVANKITSGYGTGTFQPNATCNRAMIVTFLMNYAKAAGTYRNPTTSSNFKDVAANAWYKTSVDWAVENGITSGYGKGTFSPNVTCNRAMMVTFLKKVAELPMAG